MEEEEAETKPDTHAGHPEIQFVTPVKTFSISVADAVGGSAQSRVNWIVDAAHKSGAEAVFLQPGFGTDRQVQEIAREHLRKAGIRVFTDH